MPGTIEREINVRSLNLDCYKVNKSITENRLMICLYSWNPPYMLIYITPHASRLSFARVQFSWMGLCNFAMLARKSASALS